MGSTWLWFFFATRMPFLTVNPFMGSDAGWFTGEGGCLHPSCPNLTSPVFSLDNTGRLLLFVLQQVIWCLQKLTNPNCNIITNKTYQLFHIQTEHPEHWYSRLYLTKHGESVVTNWQYIIRLSYNNNTMLQLNATESTHFTCSLTHTHARVRSQILRTSDKFF